MGLAATFSSTFINMSTETWDKNYNSLVVFVKANGHMHVPFRGETMNLACWLNHQKKRTMMAAYQKEKLLALKDYEDTLIPPKKNEDVTWENMHEKLQSFKREHGHCIVSTKDNENRDLAAWIKYQRTLAFRKDLRKERRSKLELIGFEFERMRHGRCINTDKVDLKWNIMFEQLRGFEKEHNHCNVGVKYNAPLSRWITKQRYEQKKGNLRDSRKKQLDELNFVWKLNKK
jgi:hypothetical protein